MKGLNSKTRTEYGIPKNVDGVVVTAVKRDSFAAKAGLKCWYRYISNISNKC